MGRPDAIGAQNDLRYAVFPETQRLVIDDHGTITVYDTGPHQIFGVAQAQSADRTLTFTSQHGVVSVANLQKVGIERISAVSGRRVASPVQPRGGPG